MEAVNNVDIIRYYIVQYDADEICPAISGRIEKTEMIFLLYLWPSCPPIFCFLIEGSARKVPFFLFCGVSVDRHPRAYSIDTNCRGLSAYIMPAVCCAATEGSFMGL